MKFTTRELVLLAVFGALWGLVEITLGSVFHAIDLPLTGMALGVIGVLVASIGRLFVPRRGSTLFIGAIAMVLKLFSIGSSVLGPMVGILSEAILAEIAFDLFRRPSLPAFMLANMLAALFTLVQPFITGILFFGRSMFIVWLDLLDSGARIFKLPAEAAAAIVAVLVVVHLAAGALGGWVGWGLGKTLRARLGGTTAAAAQ
jgi:ABC-type thiamin/hydroxymethylpyrimidine transport system permease subunit